MKISYQIAASFKQFKSIASNELRLIGKAFGMTTRVAQNQNLNRADTAQPLAKLKSAKGHVNVIKNMSVEFLSDEQEILKHGQLAKYRVFAKHDTITMRYPTPVDTEFMSCRHMASRELERREREKTNRFVHTKADRVQKFDVKYSAYLATQRQRMETRIHDVMLYSDDVHLFKNDGLGQFLEPQLEKLKVGEAKNFAFTTLEHVMTLTIKRNKDGYSASMWDPNYAADHIKMKFNSPRQAATVSLDKFIGAQHTASYTEKSPRLVVYELPKGWVSDASEPADAINIHAYEDGRRMHKEMVRPQWVERFNK